MANIFNKSNKINKINIDIGNSKPTTSLKIIKATIIMNVRIYLRYKANFIGGIVEITIMTAVFFLFSQVIDFRGDNLFKNEVGIANPLFIFFLSGMMMMNFQNSALYAPINSVSRDLYNGTLEYIYSGPQSRYSYLIGNIFADILSRQIFMIPMLLLLIFLIGWSTNVLYILGLLVLFLILVSSVGILVSLMAITWKQVGNIVGIFQILIQFIGGVFLPVQSFPVWLQWVAYLLPFTFAFDLIRYYSFGGNWVTLVPVMWSWVLVVVYTIVYFLFSHYLLGKVEKHAKKSGLHIL